MNVARFQVNRQSCAFTQTGKFAIEDGCVAKTIHFQEEEQDGVGEARVEIEDMDIQKAGEQYAEDANPNEVFFHVSLFEYHSQGLTAMICVRRKPNDTAACEKLNDRIVMSKGYDNKIAQVGARGRVDVGIKSGAEEGGLLEQFPTVPINIESSAVVHTLIEHGVEDIEKSFFEDKAQNRNGGEDTKLRQQQGHLLFCFPNHNRQAQHVATRTEYDAAAALREENERKEYVAED